MPDLNKIRADLRQVEKTLNPPPPVEHQTFGTSFGVPTVKGLHDTRKADHNAALHGQLTAWVKEKRLTPAEANALQVMCAEFERNGHRPISPDLIDSDSLNSLVAKRYLDTVSSYFGLRNYQPAPHVFTALANYTYPAKKSDSLSVTSPMGRFNSAVGLRRST